MAIPPLDQWADLALANRDWFRSFDPELRGKRASAVRALARREVAEAVRNHHRALGLDEPARGDPDGPWIVTGHQPELFHPGVWAKNFAVAGLARRLGGVGLNLIVDNDTLKTCSTRVPTPSGQGLATVPVEFDAWTALTPQEDQATRDEELFASFGRRVEETLDGLVPDPLIRDYWPIVLEGRTTAPTTGLRLARARRLLEAQWGARNGEARLGQVCETEAFGWFASHLLADLPRFQAVHNQALEAYRRANKIRSTHHPVAALRVQGEWREAPFWVWRADAPRRRALFAAGHRGIIRLRIEGESEPFVELPLCPDCDAARSVQRLRELPSRRIRLRTRALTTTMFARLFLADLFAHGIGGAKYDELGDVMSRAFFHPDGPPPRYATLSTTLWLPITRKPVDSRVLEDATYRLRDLAFNPERYIPDSERPAHQTWIDLKRQAIAGPTATKVQRAERRETIRRSNRMLAQAVRERVESARDDLERIRADQANDRTATNRDYAFVLHSRERLRSTLGELST